MHTLGNVLEKCCSNFVVGRIFAQVDRNEKLLGLGVDITDINTTLVREQNPVTLVIENR